MEIRGPEITELRELAERSRSLLDDLRTSSSEASATRIARLDAFGSEASDLIEKVAAEIAKELAEDLSQQVTAEHEQQVQSLEAERAQLNEQQATWEQHCDEWEAKRKEWEDVREQVEKELVEREQIIENQRQVVTESLLSSGQVNELQESVREEFAQKEQELCAQRDEAKQEAERLALELADKSDLLEQANQRLSEISDIQQKFEQALEDLQELREENAQLEQQLAERPEVGSGDSLELVRLRHERDELETQLRAATLDQSESCSEEVADLQRRFELAVEDVRRLKQENTELEERLASPLVVEPSGGNDWEEQKRQLLASLEEEGESGHERSEERASIEGTIQITDSVIAEKDREIERLREAIESDQSGGMIQVDEATNALLDEDAIIQEERQRLADLQSEWEEKLRTAELEFSVERAKIARTQSELEEQKQELASMQSQHADATKDIDSGGRWFKKLGLGGDEN